MSNYTIPFGNHRQLWCWWDMQTADYVWAKDLQEARKLSGKKTLMRICHANIEPPPHYHKPNGNLAFDAIEKIPTMKDLIHALT